jgi:hypothetical protein
MCGKDIKHRKRWARYCEDCYEKRHLNQIREWRLYGKKEITGRECELCGKNIDDRNINARFCIECCRIRHRQQTRETYDRTREMVK